MSEPSTVLLWCSLALTPLPSTHQSAAVQSFLDKHIPITCPQKPGPPIRKSTYNLGPKGFMTGQPTTPTPENEAFFWGGLGVSLKARLTRPLGLTQS